MVNQKPRETNLLKKDLILIITQIHTPQKQEKPIITAMNLDTCQLKMIIISW